MSIWRITITSLQNCPDITILVTSGDNHGVSYEVTNGDSYGVSLGVGQGVCNEVSHEIGQQGVVLGQDLCFELVVSYTSSNVKDHNSSCIIVIDLLTMMMVSDQRHQPLTCAPGRRSVRHPGCCSLPLIHVSPTARHPRHPQYPKTSNTHAYLSYNRDTPEALKNIQELQGRPVSMKMLTGQK